LCLNKKYKATAFILFYGVALRILNVLVRIYIDCICLSAGYLSTGKFDNRIADVIYNFIRNLFISIIAGPKIIE